MNQSGEVTRFSMATSLVAAWLSVPLGSQGQRSPMLYEVKLPVEEIRLLASLKGRPVHRITSDGWSVGLELDELVLDVRPEDVATPDDAHPSGDVDRPKIVLMQSSSVGEHHRPIVNDLGKIASVQILSTVISFSPVRTCPPVSLADGVEIPEGDGYGWVYYRPSEREVALRELSQSQAIIDLDVAVELSTERSTSVVLYTRGYFVHASLGTMPKAEDWVRFGAYVRRSANVHM